jgi:hypothetical protein
MQTDLSMVRTKEKSGALVTDGLGTDILMGTIYAVGAGAVGIVGAWAISCLVAGVIHAGSPLVLVGSWIKAVTGM